MEPLWTTFRVAGWIRNNLYSSLWEATRVFPVISHKFCRNSLVPIWWKYLERLSKCQFCGWTSLGFSFFIIVVSLVVGSPLISCTNKVTWCIWCINFSPKSYVQSPIYEMDEESPSRIEWDMSLVIVKFGSYCCRLTVNKWISRHLQFFNHSSCMSFCSSTLWLLETKKITFINAFLHRFIP